MTARLILGDCLDVLATLDENSVDAVVTDPPYGLEFMGQEWDRLDGGLPQEAVWKGRRGKGGSSTDKDPTKPGGRHGASFGGKRSAFKRCARCSKRQFSGSPCRCDEPAWVLEYPGGPPSGMVRMQRWHGEWSRAVFRVLKPGGHLVAFGGTRTYHRLACAIEDAGFEIRDCLAWLYGSGFPKSLDVSKAIDKAERGVPQGGSDPTSPNHGKFRTQATEGKRGVGDSGRGYGAGPGQFMREAGQGERADPATAAARQWAGWGTALKPAHEPVVLARKPLSESTVAANVQRWGTGAVNVDGCRVEHAEECRMMAPSQANIERPSEKHRQAGRRAPTLELKPAGRWPANVVLDETAAARLDEQAGEKVHSAGHALSREESSFRSRGTGHTVTMTGVGWRVGDSGGPSRFFYTAKASTSERSGQDAPLFGLSTVKNTHPTVKPLDLMRWLCKLVTPLGGTILDPFTGSGTTGVAAASLGFDFIGIEREAEYVKIAEARVGVSATTHQAKESP